MPFSRAYIVAGDLRLTLPVNPYTAQWSYQENTTSTDTLGGRVVQLLSVQVTDLSVESVAGGRRELQKVADGIREVMNYHIQTSLPARFVVPSRAWKFSVYVRAMPSIGWDVAATTYPYQLTMAILEDLTGVKTRQITQAALERLAEGIGYIPAVHGGSTGAFTALVDSMLKLAPEMVIGGGAGVGTDSNIPPGESGVNPDKGHLSPEEIARVAAWAFGRETNIAGGDLMKNVIYAVAVCLHESGGYVGNNNTQAVNGTAYGLWQGNATNGISQRELQTAEGNARWMAREVQANYNLQQSGNPYPLRTWEHAWWAYWGVFRTGAYKSSMNVATQAAKAVL